MKNFNIGKYDGLVSIRLEALDKTINQLIFGADKKINHTWKTGAATYSIQLVKCRIKPDKFDKQFRLLFDIKIIEKRKGTSYDYYENVQLIAIAKFEVEKDVKII